jgi:hypothetical protein
MSEYSDVPTVEVIWDRTHTARKPNKCQVCGDTITPGQRYQSTGQRVDGTMEIWVRHEFGERYPSGCPRLRERDMREEAEQFVKDAALWRSA